ncbi:MAG: glycosyltransferase family 39 protein, partial [Dehalococcoidia bacterium]|nr:glycosyltransferase family 39 protein [Dehalococcoidia bacterium]
MRVFAGNVTAGPPAEAHPGMAGLSDRLWPVLVFGLTLVSLLVLTPQFVAELDPPTGDEPFYLQMAQSLINDGDFEMTNNYEQRDYLEFYPKDTSSPDFRGWQTFPLELPPHKSNTLKPGLYEKHGVGLAVLIAPAYQAAGRLGPVVLMGLLGALLAANIFLLAREFSGDLKASLVATLGMAFTSPLLPYSFLIFPAVPAALLSVYAFRRARLSPGNNRLQLVGLAASLAILPWLHAGYLLISIPLFFFFLAKSWGDRRALAVVLPVVAASGGLFLYYYYDLYGMIIPNYADHAEFLFPFGTLQGMLGLLLDQQWGLLVYSPFYLVALAGIGLIFRTRRLEAIWLLLATAPTFLFFASYSQWWGEWCPPARYLAPILPLAAAPVALFLRHSDLPGRVLSGFLLAVSLLIMGGFAVAPKLMYNHPTGESQLFLALAGASGFDLTPWLPSLVNPGPGVYWQASLAVVIVAAVVAFLIGSTESKKGAGVVPGGFQALYYLWSLGRRFEEKHPRVLVALALGFILLTGAYFRFEGLDWDAGQHMHPDERFITMVANDTSLPSSIAQYFDSASSPLNPFNRNFKSYPYGTSFLFMAKFLAGPAGMEGYDRINLLGRFLSAIFDLGTVVLVFLLGCMGGFKTRPYNRWVGLLGAFLYATAALAIQYSHFFVAESFTTFFLVLTLFLALRVSQGGGWAGYAGMGLACGLALASKVSVALVLPVMAVAAALSYRSSRSLKPIFGLALALIATFLAFRVAQPYAFAGTGFFDLRPSLQFWSNVEEQRRMAEGSLEFPYTLQWAGTIPYLFPLQNLFWGLGPAMMLAALGGAALALYQLIRERCLAHLLVLLWVGLAFVYFGGQMVKYMRYLLPVYPFLALLAAYLVVWLVERGTRSKERGEGSLLLVPLVAVLLGSFLWALAFTQIYRQPLTRVEASQWIFQNVPQGATVAVEHWDDPLPMSVRNVEPRQYRQLFLELYNDDSPAKVDILVDQLSQADYIFISSNRLYGSIPRLPLRYPMTIEYYRLLFSGELGFQREKVFVSYPKLGALDLVDDAADEAFTVYDHPKVLIFRKTDAFSRERVRQLLSAVPLDNVVRQGLKDAPFNGLLMPPDLLEANRSGGTWTEIFDPQGLPASLPFPAWYLLVQVLSFAVLPLGMVALGGLPDRGYPLFKTLGVLLVSYFSWLAASLRLAPYTRVTILAAVVLLCLLSALALWRRGPQIRAA